MSNLIRTPRRRVAEERKGFERWGSWGKRVAKCATDEIPVSCECAWKWAPILCGVRWLCARCRDRYYYAFRERAVVGLKANGEGHFITLTVPRAPVEDQWRTLREGWKSWRALAQDFYGRSWPFLAVVEVTPGRDSRGHVHQHVAYHAHGRQDWARWRHWWTMSTGGIAFFKQMYGTPEKRAGYLAKYTSKGVDIATWPVELGMEVLRAARGRRLIASSRGYLPPQERGCASCGKVHSKVTYTSEVTRVWGKQWGLGTDTEK